MRQEFVAACGVVLLLVAGAGYFYWTTAERARQAALAAEEQAAREAEQVAAALPQPGPRTPEEYRALVGRARARGVAFLLQQQSPDGAWRSDVYGTFKDGTALTPLAVCALQDAADPGAAAAVRKGSEFLARMVKPDGSIDGGEGGLDYPVYTASLAVVALSHPDNKDLLTARDAWLRYLLERQLTETLGWKPEDKEFGGWGYCRVIPTRPEPGKFAPPLIESNLSATVFALDALKAAGVADRAVSEKALVFVRRCQNWEPAATDPRPPSHLDGGFHFIYDDPVRNKAGSVPDATPRPLRFYSYGSTTADGLRALLLCGEPDAARVAGAREWLRHHFRPDRHPGQYAPQHERNRDAVYYYYAASASRALRAAGVKELANTNPWAAPLAAALLDRQKDDGSWSNPVELVRENDPIVATCNAVAALANCRAATPEK